MTTDSITVELLSETYELDKLFPGIMRHGDDFEYIYILKDNIFIYCEYKELTTIYKNHIDELGEKYIYCYDFNTNKLFKTYEKIDYYLTNIQPFREGDVIKYIVHEYYPAGSWTKVYTLN